MRNWPALGLVAAGLTLAVDQLTKALVVDHFARVGPGSEWLLPIINLAMTENRGISFGIFDRAGRFGPWLLSGLAIAIILLLLWALRRTRSFWSAVGMGLIIGGAVGNLVDRLRLGSVVDFLDLHFGTWHPFVFNGADAAITGGVICLLLDGLLSRPESLK